VIVGPIDRQGAAVEQNQEDGFAEGADLLEQLFLSFSQVDVGVIAAEK
jgi:hypothetical protein